MLFPVVRSYRHHKVIAVEVQCSQEVSDGIEVRWCNGAGSRGVEKLGINWNDPVLEAAQTIPHRWKC